MVDYRQAREIALGCVSDKAWFDFCTENENAFVFSRFEDMTIGGMGPCAVMKADGSAVPYAAVLDKVGDVLHAYDMDERGVLSERDLVECGFVDPEDESD